MTLEEINREISERKKKVSELAEELGVNTNSLRQILAGQRPLTEQLARHISYVLGKRESILVYRVQASEKRVEELTAGKGCKCDKDRVEAMQAIIAYNMQQLAELGEQASWTPEQRAAWGLGPEVPATGSAYRPPLEPFA